VRADGRQKEPRKTVDDMAGGKSPLEDMLTEKRR
jgi:hypothetical protein